MGTRTGLQNRIQIVLFDFQPTSYSTRVENVEHGALEFLGPTIESNLQSLNQGIPTRRLERLQSVVNTNTALIGPNQTYGM